MQPDLERDFEEFQRRGTARALGRVFDRAAPELLIVAGHLARDVASAEDLVQTTFVSAVERAAQWDSARPLMPWLITILMNAARREARRARLEIPWQQERVLPHPSEEAEARELAEAVTHATAELGSPYRQVLALRLAHGLEPRAIAHALGRPLETVKTQLKRGLALLRKVLPKGLVPMLARERGLAAVRAAVFAKAKSTFIARGGLGGLMLFQKMLAISLALLSTLAVIAAAWPLPVCGPRACWTIRTCSSRVALAAPSQGRRRRNPSRR